MADPDPGEVHLNDVPSTGPIAGQRPPEIIGSMIASEMFYSVAKEYADWWSLPISLRRQWYAETFSGTNPSQQLLDSIRAVLAVKVESPTVTLPGTPSPSSPPET